MRKSSVRGIAVLRSVNEKTAIAGGFSGILRRTSFCCRVNLPLLHRRWAGMAKPKIKGKGGSVAHGVVRDGPTDYNTNI
jgi:hypothetical protein